MLSDEDMGVLYDLPIELAIAGLDWQGEKVQLLLTEYDRLAAEVARLRPLAAVGAAVERLSSSGRAVEYRPRSMRWMVREGREECQETEIRGIGTTLAAALRDAGLMEVSDGTV